MAVRDQRPFDRPGRVDVKIAELAAYARGRKRENVFSTHRRHICCSLMSRTLGRRSGSRKAAGATLVTLCAICCPVVMDSGLTLRALE
jgi:hypothetical protein